MKSKLNKIIAEKEAKIKKLKERAAVSEDVKELRSINEDIDTIINELIALKEMYSEMDTPAEEASKRDESEATGEDVPGEEVVAEDITEEDIAAAAEAIVEAIDGESVSEVSVEEILMEELTRKKQNNIQGKRFNVMASMGAEKRNKNTSEKRAQQFASTGRMKIGNKESRSVLLSSGQIATPTKVGGINEPGTQYSSIVDMVTVEDMTGIGSYKEAYIDSWQSAGPAVEGTASTPSDPTFKTVSINPF